MKKNDKRIKLDAPVPVFDSFTYECTNCGAYLFASDNFCPGCGENVSNLIGFVVLKEEKDG